MKTFFTKSALYLALTIPAFFFLGCDDSEEGGSYEFSVEPTVLTFSAKQETQTLSVRTYGDWSIVLPQDAAWLKVSAMSGRGPAEIEVTAENYYRTDTSRTARLTVTGGNSGDFPVEVVQQKLQMNDLSGRTIVGRQQGTDYGPVRRPRKQADFLFDSRRRQRSDRR